jgi:hypothetical protein
MSREIVRRMASDRTHVADVEETVERMEFFGRPYRAPAQDVRALCGVLCRTTETVIMREGSTVKCPACRYLGNGRESVIL